MRVIGIDGPAGAGKSTVARALAARLGLDYLDTGDQYRAVTFAALRRGIDPYEVVYASDYRLVFLGRSRLTREWHRVSGRVEVKPPHGLVVNGT